MALINTLTAIECGVDIVDATVLGMGRGAGNLKTELLLTALSAKEEIDFDFNVLSKVVDEFAQLHKEYDWGTNLPYMVAGANSLPQNVVMDLVGKRFYSYNSIIRVLRNQSNGIQDNINLLPFVATSKSNRILILGGGPSVKQHAEAIRQYLKINPDILLIHASSKNALVFDSLENKQIFCLVGNEGYRMENVFKGKLPNDSICVLPPFPRKMGTYIPKSLIGNSYQLEEISFTNKQNENITAVVLEICKILETKIIYSAGYDGYTDSITQMELELFNENNQLFIEFLNYEVDITSLTPTNYSILNQKSIYSFI
jgi:4-hydroxy 2-oxovalerate aldolase